MTRFARTLSAVVVASLAGLAIAGAREVLGAGDVRAASPPAFRAVTAAERRDIEIEFYSDRAARDPIGAADRSRLAALYLDRGRETGSFADLQRAEARARESLALRESHNAQSHVLLAAALMVQHRFADARVAASRADAMEPGVASHRALLGEIALELGDYDRARAIFDSLRREPLSDVVSLRLARWYEISGHPDWAELRLRAVLADWSRIPDVAPAHLAWLRLRLAELAMKDGRLADADSALAAGLRLATEDHRLLGAAARLAARRGRWSQAIDFGERAILRALEPATLGVLSDAYAMRRDSARAEQYAAIMRSVAMAEPGERGIPHRVWMLWLLDRGDSVNQVLALTRRELAERKDVYGWDVYAWALHRSGRHREAAIAMREALRMGTRDPLLARHAASIRTANGS